MNGVTITPLRKIENPKGDIFHVMKASSEGYVSFGEAYFSNIFHRQIKGWKKHSLATLNLVVIVGKIRFVIYQEDEGFFEVTLGNENYSRITIKPGFWVAFQGMENGVNTLLNISNLEHDPDEAININLDSILFDWNFD